MHMGGGSSVASTLLGAVSVKYEVSCLAVEHCKNQSACLLHGLQVWHAESLLHETKQHQSAQLYQLLLLYTSGLVLFAWQHIVKLKQHTKGHSKVIMLGRISRYELEALHTELSAECCQQQPDW